MQSVPGSFEGQCVPSEVGQGCSTGPFLAMQGCPVSLLERTPHMWQWCTPVHRFLGGFVTWAHVSCHVAVAEVGLVAGG